MALDTFQKQLLSGSTSGIGIPINATTSGSANTIHTAHPTNLHECWIAFCNNSSNDVLVTLAIGVMRCLAKKQDLIEKSYIPTEMKKIVSGKGTAEKEDIIAAVEKVFTGRKFIDKENHAADSAGIALCYVYEVSKPLLYLKQLAK